MLKPKKFRKLVKDLLKRNKLSKPPVPVETIAENLGIVVRYVPLKGDLSGALIRTDGEAYIGVNSLHHSNRRRFTVAHELAHFILHDGIRMHLDTDFRVNRRDDESSKAVNPEEIEANRFAAELLMPTELLLRDIGELEDVDQDAVEFLARRYKVSPQAMKIRLGNFGFYVAN